jgi:hypothetical protein
VKVLGELEPVESKLFVSLQRVSISAEAFLQLVRLKRLWTLRTVCEQDHYIEGLRRK